MEIPQHPRTQYSNRNSSQKPLGYSNSTVRTQNILSSVVDLIVNPDYNPWYAKQLRTLGNTRFMELANKARAGSEKPHILFKWMLENNKIVR